MPNQVDRRSFLIGAGALGGAALTGGLTACNPPPGSILNLPASSSPISHVVVLMMENRSFDHWLGWLGSDQAWLENASRLYGDGTAVDANPHQTYLDPTGNSVPTAHMLDFLAGGNPWRGCDHPDPGHGWNAGRRQRDSGFLATGSGNDQFATGYYLADDLPFSSLLARRFTVCDRWHASILGPTYPNRLYLHSAQSGGYKTNYLPINEGGYGWPTIWEKLTAAGVSAGYYYVDLPVTALFGTRMNSYNRPIDDYFTHCEQGTLPQVTFIDPGFNSGSRTDNHPHADIRAGEAFQRDVFAAFARSPHWGSGVFILTYDEWGGFFDHVAPPTGFDDRYSANDADNFAQLGFRVPTVVASPYSRVGAVDHTNYDHTSVLRFLEWRFLGAPPVGIHTNGANWWLTTRDQWANNVGLALVDTPTIDVGFDLDVALDPPSPECGAGAAVTGADTERSGRMNPPGYEKHPFEQALDAGYFERIGIDPQPSLMATDWVY
ncbi:MAG: phospholipase [Microthrixaceae bacterium]|nr:phospholipase [Microthrixaceae bacterium]